MKIVFAVLVSSVGIMINCLIFKLYFHYDFHQIIVIAFISTLFSILWNLIGVFIDMKNPKLEWTNEAEAIKQNINYHMYCGFHRLFLYCSKNDTKKLFTYSNNRNHIVQLVRFYTNCF